MHFTNKSQQLLKPGQQTQGYEKSDESRLTRGQLMQQVKAYEEENARLVREIDQLKQHGEEREDIIRDLVKALVGIKLLHGLLPICSSCKKIRDDTGSWNLVETYISKNSEAEFTHGICPECERQLYPQLFKSK